MAAINDPCGFGVVEVFTGPELVRLIDRQPHLAATVRRLIDAPPRCPACDGAVAAVPLLWVRAQLPGGMTIWGGICNVCAYSGSDLPGAVAAGLRRDGIADLRIVDAANLHHHGGWA